MWEALLTGKNKVTLYRYVGVLFLFTLFTRALLVTWYNGSYGGIEQNVIYGIQRLLMGQPLYQPPNSGSYAVIQYTPLWYYLVAVIAKIAGITAANVQGLYVIARTMAVFFNLLTVIVSALILYTWRYNRFESFLFALPMLIILTSHYYTRGDSLHFFLFAAGIYACVRYRKNGKFAHLVSAAVLSGGCIMAKQSGILLAGIVVCSLLMQRKYLQAILYVLIAAGIAYAIARFCVNGDWTSFYQNVYLGLKNGIGLYFLSGMLIKSYYLPLVPFYFLAGIMVWVALKRPTDSIYSILTTGAVLSFAFAVITGLKKGSSNNYFTEFLFFVLLAVPYLLEQGQGGIYLFRLFGHKINVRCFTLAAFFILITAKSVGLALTAYAEKRMSNHADEYAAEQKLYVYMTREMGLKPGEHVFFTDRQFLDNIFSAYTVMPTKDVVSQVYLADPGTFDYSAFVAGMNTGLVNYIVTTTAKPDINEWEKQIPFIHFDKDRFMQVARYAGYTIYIYKGTN